MKRPADATRCVHAGEDRHGQSAPLTTPIAQTSVFVIPVARRVASLRRRRSRHLSLLALRQLQPSKRRKTRSRRSKARTPRSSRRAEWPPSLDRRSRLLRGGRRDRLHARHLRRNGEAVRRRACALRHQDAFHSLPRPRQRGALLHPQDPHAVSGDADESHVALRRHCGVVRYRSSPQSVRGRRQHLRDASLAEAARARRRHRHAFGDEVSRRTQRSHRRRARRIRKNGWTAPAS